MLNPMLKSRWFAACLHTGLWLLLVLVACDLGGNASKFADAEGVPGSAKRVLPMDKIQALFSPHAWPRLLTDTNSANPFFTKHFIPAPPSPPRTPATRKVELTYQGFYVAGDSPKHAFVRVGDGLFVGPAGAKVVANLFVADIQQQSLVLTNAAAQTNVLLFNAKKEFEVPTP
jgi:hypothetical protein